MFDNLEAKTNNKVDKNNAPSHFRPPISGIAPIASANIKNNKPEDAKNPKFAPRPVKKEAEVSSAKIKGRAFVRPKKNDLISLKEDKTIVKPTTSSKSFYPFIGLAVFLFFGILLFYVGVSYWPEIVDKVSYFNIASEGSDKNSVQCALDAKLCSDGTSVKRVPPDCNFEDCPSQDNCGQLGAILSSQVPRCCAGLSIVKPVLKLINDSNCEKLSDGQQCLACPDGECGSEENICNCPEDCGGLSDADGDGLFLYEEMLYNTDPNNADSDNDSFNDRLEIENGYDPNGPGRL